MSWSEKDLQNLKSKGLKVDDNKINVNKKPKIKIIKRSLEKDTIHAILDMLKLKNQIEDFVLELQFDEARKFRFDWAIPSLKIGIEYEGIFSKKSRHTTAKGFSEDCSKYNLAIQNGWRVLRYTALNYQNLENDLLKIIKTLQ